MNSIPSPERPDQILKSIARKVAFESRLPWRVEELRAKAVEAYETAELPAASLGLSREQVYRRMLQIQSINDQVKMAAQGMDRLPPGEQKPASERIEAALGTFTSEQWKILVEGFGQVDVEALLSFIRLDADRLKQRLGARKVARIEGRAIMRDVELWLRENRSKVVPITDVDWALPWPELVRQANREGKGHRATGRSVAELSSDRSIARLFSKRDEQTDHEMKVSPYELKRWRERVERLTYEQYLLDVGADDEEKRGLAFIDYHMMIRKKYQRKN
jgi:hypothetical protein